MRNLEAEAKLVQKIFMLAGAIFLLGLVALAVGAEILILSFWDEPAKFWIWQGVWCIVQGFVLATVGRITRIGMK